MSRACASLAKSSSRRPGQSGDGGFTLIEVIVAAVVMLVAMVGAISAFNLVTQSLRGTGLRADQSRRIDAQIAEISRLIEDYTACTTPAGAVPPSPFDPATACLGDTSSIVKGNSFYYFPDPSDASNVNAFFAACGSATASSHITANFIAAIDAIVPLPGVLDQGVARDSAARVNSSDASNSLVRITWRDSANRVIRQIQVVPLLSAWCP
jgi:prepilin-type N-terminal cleavage/methylation domain-containing protein